MALFQKSVTTKHLKNLNQDTIDQAFEQFQKFYGNTTRLANIIQLKEENYQEGFLREVFVQSLGYTINPDENYDLSTEFKNQKDKRKADGAIIRNGKAIGVIELKSTKTKDLESIKQQAFGYKNNQEDCKYVITSNFRSLRFYIGNAIEFEEFDLFQLNKERFTLLYLLLSKESIFSDLPEILKAETKFHEETITAKLYADYKHFKDNLFDNLVLHNQQYDKLTLFKKSQKLLDRFLFIFFAEDSGLIPPNTTTKIINDWKTLRKLRRAEPLYNIFRDYFRYLDRGEIIEEWGEIPAYNGGLFRKDAILDNPETIIDDAILEKDSLKLSAYDYRSEVDVNILGHIFEHSLNEIDEIEAQLTGAEIDTQQTKRKKDGVFYTPKYITKYIVDSTLGKLCETKKTALGLLNAEVDESFYRIVHQGTKKEKRLIEDKGKTLFQNLNDYKDWLLTLKILDPACGSGAFLNQTLDLLVAEHSHTDKLIAELSGIKLRIYDTDKKILENNIFGVDINEESVDIAKLSLWLRTAQRGRQLSELANSIKCGNSLVNDPEVAGEKAFDWHTEFKEIMDNGGFDVIIGNPPYVRLQGLKANYEKESYFYEQHYKSATSNYDIYVLFLEQSLKLLKPTGKASYILPHKFLISEFGKGIRTLFTEQHAVEELVHFGSNMVFDGASTYTCIVTLSFGNTNLYFKQLKPSEIDKPIEFNVIDYSKLSAANWNLNNAGITEVLEKLQLQPLRVKDVFAKVFVGLQTSGDDVYLIKGKRYGTLIKAYSKSLDKMVEIERAFTKPILKGEDISKYNNLTNRYYVLFPYHIENGKASPMTEDFIKSTYPLAYKYLKENETFLRGRERNRMDAEDWFLYIYPKSLAEFEQPKIITPDISFGSNMSYDEGGFYHGTTLYSFIKNDAFQEDYKFWLSIFNSKLLWFFIKNTGTELRGGYFRYKTKYLEPFPLPMLQDISQQVPFVEKVNSIIALNKQLQTEENNFFNTLQEDKGIANISRNIEHFYQMEYDVFKKELLKQKVKISLGNENNEWRSYFETSKQAVAEIQTKIQQTEAEIDTMVFALYGLTPSEIEIVENDTK